MREREVDIHVGSVEVKRRQLLATNFARQSDGVICAAGLRLAPALPACMRCRAV